MTRRRNRPPACDLGTRLTTVRPSAASPGRSPCSDRRWHRPARTDGRRLPRSNSGSAPGRRPTGPGRCSPAHGSPTATPCRRAPRATGRPALTRDKWLAVLLRELGFGRVPAHAGRRHRKPTAARSRSATNGGDVPVHLLGWGVDLDRKTPGVAGAAERAPHAMVQELLNRSDDHLWALLANGGTLRLLRDSSSLVGQSYVEFDLASHVRRRGLQRLRRALPALPPEPLRARRSRGRAGGLLARTLAHRRRRDRRPGARRPARRRAARRSRRSAPASSGTRNAELRHRLDEGDLDLADYHRGLLRLVYRLLFCFVAEDRGLLLDPDADADRQAAVTPTGSPPPGSGASLPVAGAPATTTSGRRCRSSSTAWARRAAGPSSASRRSAGSSRTACRRRRWLPTRQRRAPRRGPPPHASSSRPAAARSESSTTATSAPRSSAASTRASSSSSPATTRRTAPSLSSRSPATSARPAAPTTRRPRSSTACSTPPSTRSSTRPRRPPTRERRSSRSRCATPLVGRAISSSRPPGGSPARLARVRAEGGEPTVLDAQAAMHDVVGPLHLRRRPQPHGGRAGQGEPVAGGLQPGRPLSFLDAHIKVGNALLGTTPALLAARHPRRGLRRARGRRKGTVVRSGGGTKRSRPRCTGSCSPAPASASTTGVCRRSAGHRRVRRPVARRHAPRPARANASWRVAGRAPSHACSPTPGAPRS